MARSNPQGRWTATKTRTVNDYSPAQSGNYQEQIHQDSSGFLYRVTCEDTTGAGAYVLRLYTNNATATEIDLGFANGVTFAHLCSTTVLFGYPVNALLNLTEFSSVLFGDKIYVAFIHEDVAIGRCVELISFDIGAAGATSCLRLAQYLPDAYGAGTNYRACDIDIQRVRGRAFLWISFIEYETIYYRYNWFQQPIPPEPLAAGACLDTVLTFIEGVDVGAGSQYMGIRYCNHDTGIFSITNGLLLTDLPAGLITPRASNQFENFTGWHCHDDEHPLTAPPGGGGQYTDEEAQDAVGNILTDTATVDFTYNDAGVPPTITADVVNGSITYAKIQNVSASPRLLGRQTAAAGSVEEITVGTNMSFVSGSSPSVLSSVITPGGFPYNVLATDFTMLIALATGNKTCNLPTAAGITGKIYNFKIISQMLPVNTLTIQCSGAETLDGANAPGFTTNYLSIMIISDGTNWHRI